jgi:ABC-type uncharacterized transport system fused permease/ATPase subunit
MLEQVLANIVSGLLMSKYFLYALGFTVVLWILYVSIMTLNKRKKQLITGIAFYLLLPVGFIVDVLYNWTLANLIFWDLAREATLSQRLTRYIKHDNTWRSTIAVWVCTHLIEPWDQGHCHLDKLP